MNRGAFERRCSRLDEALRGLRFNRQILLLRFATKEESHRILELLGKLAKIRGILAESTAPEEMAEIGALFETWTKRLKKSLDKN